MTGQGRSHGWAWEDIGPTTGEPIRMSFSPQRALLQTETLLNFISCPGGWFPTIPQVKKPDVEVLAGVVTRALWLWRPDGVSAKYSKMTLRRHM